MAEISSEKKRMREHYLSLRDSIPEEKRAEMGKAIAKNLFRTVQYNDAATIACYYAVRSEVPTMEIMLHALSHGKVLLLPRTGRDGIELCRVESLDSLEKGAYGIPEPQKSAPSVRPSEAEMFILPAVAVDRAGNRLGYGPGHYDRLLKSTAAPKAALVFSAQIASSIPQEPHDVAADLVISEDGIIVCR